MARLATLTGAHIMDQKNRHAFIEELSKIGILRFDEQENLWQLAKRCASTVGIPAAGAGLVMGAGVGGSVTLGTLAIPAAVAGTLAGLAGGTMSCMMINVGMRDELRKLSKTPVEAF